MNKKINCFILAAGLGERLRPITNYLPKPLLPIAGKPILERILEKISTLPVEEIGINLHYKKELIHGWVRRSSFSGKITFFPEDPILDTGGALKNAEKFLCGRPFLVHNADILSDIDLPALIAAHLSSDNLVTLAVHDYPKYNNVAIDQKGFLRGVGRSYTLQPDERWIAFTGIAIYDPEFLALLPAGKSSVVDGWRKAVAEGHRVGALDVTGCRWSDIGTPAAYASAVFSTLKDEGESVYFHPTVQGCSHAVLDGSLAVEQRSAFEKGVTLKNCIVLPHTRVEADMYNGCIIGPEFSVAFDLQEAGLVSREYRTLIGTGGSDRRYFRVQHNDTTAVLMQCLPNDPDFTRHIEYTQFFRKHNVPVPELYEVNPRAMQAFFEDLGDMSLYNWLKCPRDASSIEQMYRKVLDTLISIHTKATAHVDECKYIHERVFDYEHLRWETSYFMERFVGQFMKGELYNSSTLDGEFRRIADEVDSFPKAIVHRDFQSQNIMIDTSGEPRVIDYQGARRGSPWYDVASMLWDPYYRLDDMVRNSLVHYYIHRMEETGGKALIGSRVDDMLLLCRLQRHMQALGAYGFLSMVKGKKYFLKHIPQCLSYLKAEVALVQGRYPELYALVQKIKE